MGRNSSCSALILRVKPSGESNREAWFLSEGEGLLRATVFGGPKSRLRAYVSPFHQGTLWLYHDPVRDSHKISDFDVRNWRPGLRELYARTMAASAVAETILATHGGGGNWQNALALAAASLDALETAGEKTCVRIFLHFLWNWADLLGIRPDLRFCASCASEIPRDKSLRYSSAEGSLLCTDCAAGERGSFSVGPGARLWIKASENLDPSHLARLSLDDASLNQARALITTVMAGALGKKLHTWDLV